MKRIGLMVGLAVVAIACSKPAPPEIAEARNTVKRLKFAAWDVQTCKTYQLAGYKVCKYDRESGYNDNGPYDSMGNYLTNGCDEWLDRANNYCPNCTSAGKCNEPFE